MKRSSVILFAVLLLFTSPEAGAAAYEYQFRHFSTTNSDLCYDGVSKILQDSRGFIWIGTFNGLNRFDGTRFRVYHKNDIGLNSDFIHALLEDNDGNIWVGTDAGVTRYIKDTDTFEPFLQTSNIGTTIRNKVTALYKDESERIWIISNYQGCFCYDPGSGELLNFRDRQGNATEYNIDAVEIYFRRIVSDGKGGFWLSKYHSNLYHADGDLSNLQVAEILPDRDYFAGDEIEQLFLRDGNLIVASNLHGISIYDPESKSVESVFRLPSGVTLIDASIFRDRWIWLSTNKGTWKYDLDGKEHTLQIRADSGNPMSLSNDYVYTTFMDRDGNLWIGTKDSGLNFSSPFYHRFAKEYNSSGNSLKGAVLSGFAYDGERYVWITSENQGLLRYDTVWKTTESLIVPGLPDRLFCPCFDSGQLWLGSVSGLCRLDTRSMQVKDYGPIHRSTGPTDPKMYMSYLAPDGSLFFANTLSIFRYDRVRDTFEQLSEFDGAFATSMVQTSDGLYWISTYATGVFLWDSRERRIIRNYRFKDGLGLPSDKIASILADKEGRVWTIGFSNGFAKFNGDGFDVYDRANFPSMTTDVYFCAVQGNDGNLWFNTDKGMMQFNPESGAVGVFSSEDGLLDSKMLNCSIVLPDGEIFAGSNNGFIHFNPMALSKSASLLDVMISRMDVGAEKMAGNVNEMREVILGPSDNSFGFEFSLMSYSSPASNKLRCQLTGYDKGWKDVSASKTVRYYNVPAGSYCLRVMSSVDGQNWQESHSPMTIVVKPRFFNSIWGFMIIVSVLFLMTCMITIVVYKRQGRLSRQREEAYKKEADTELFYDKMNFFSHVVHEIKTPLTLIQTPLQNIMGKDAIDEEVKHDLAVMRNNTNYLSTLVNELLEFVRVERHSYVLDKKVVELVQFIDSIIFNYTDTLENKNLKFSFVHSPDQVWVSVDLQALSKIINNLLTNALKYAGNFVEVNLRTNQDRKVVVSFTNDGMPIPKEFRDAIFKPFVQYRKDNSGFSMGVGLGLPLAQSLAKMHSGDLILGDGEQTCFILTLPAVEAPENEILPEEDNMDSTLQDGPESALPVILIADDNAELCDYLAHRLKDGYQVLKAGDGNSALEIIRENNIDLLITDISMPGKDGLTLCREIRDDIELSHLPIIILSARSSIESKIQAMNTGADLYLEKPFDFEFLKSSILNILDRRSLMRNVATRGMAGLDISIFGLPKKDEEFFNKFDKIITDNLDNSQLSNEMISEMLCISQSSMIRKIRKLLNTSPNSYIRNKRLSVAAQMLKDSHGNNITEICYSVGFTNVSYFAKCFKEKYGVVPSEYIR